MTRDLDAMLQPDAFIIAIQFAWDAFKTRSNMRVYGVSDPQAWCDKLVSTGQNRARGTRQVVESILVAAIYANRRADDRETRVMLNRAKFLLLNY